MRTVVRVLISGVAVILAAIIVVAIQNYAGFAETNSYLAGGVGGVAGVLVWQLTGRKNPENTGVNG